jgi:hypothetical protein
VSPTTSVAVTEIARLLAFQQIRILHRKGHRHARHEALDVLVLDDNFVVLGADGQNLAVQFVLSLAGVAGRRARGAADEWGDQCGEQEPTTNA